QSIACRAARLPKTWRRLVMRRNPAKPAQPAEVRCQPALAFVSGVESPPNRLPVTPLAARITFTTTIIILFPGLEFLATPRRPAQRLPMPSPLLLLFRAAVLLRLRKLNLRRGLQPEVAPKWPRAELSRIGRTPAIPSISTTCLNSTPPTLLSSAPAYLRSAACQQSVSFLSRCSKPGWAT